MSVLYKVENFRFSEANLPLIIRRTTSSAALALLLISVGRLENPELAKGTHLGNLAYGVVSPETFLENNVLLRIERDAITRIPLPDWLFTEDASRARRLLARLAAANVLSNRVPLLGTHKIARELRNPEVGDAACRDALSMLRWAALIDGKVKGVRDALCRLLEEELSPGEVALRTHWVLDTILEVVDADFWSLEAFTPLAEEALALTGLSVSHA